MLTYRVRVKVKFRVTVTLTYSDLAALTHMLEDERRDLRQVRGEGFTVEGGGWRVEGLGGTSAVTCAGCASFLIVGRLYSEVAMEKPETLTQSMLACPAACIFYSLQEPMGRARMKSEGTETLDLSRRGR